MNSLPLILGVGIFCFVLLYISSQLDKEHNLWKFMTYLFVIFSLTILAKGAVDNYNNCEIVVINSSVVGAVTHNTYDQLCFEIDSSAPTSFMKSNTILIRLLGMYMLIFILYAITDSLTGVFDKFRKGNK